MSGGEGYVAAAYLVFLALVLVYLGIMASKLSRIERQVVELAEEVDARERDDAKEREPVG